MPYMPATRTLLPEQRRWPPRIKGLHSKVRFGCRRLGTEPCSRRIIDSNGLLVRNAEAHVVGGTDERWTVDGCCELVLKTPQVFVFHGDDATGNELEEAREQLPRAGGQLPVAVVLGVHGGVGVVQRMRMTSTCRPSAC